MRITRVALIALLLAGCTQAQSALRDTAAPVTEVPTPASSASEGEFSRKRAMGHIRALSQNIGIRERATRGEYLGSRYIARRLRSFGYDVDIQRFAVDGAKSRNVIASWPGSARHGVVIGAHMDSVPGSPGANDNASGVAVMLEVARLVAGEDPSRWVSFVAFGAEERGADGRGLIGSTYYVEQLDARARRMQAGMVSVDMVADGRPLVVGNAGIGPVKLARKLSRQLTEAGIANSYEQSCPCSDHAPFEEAGIPAAFVWSGDEPDYHAPSDVPSNLRPRDLARTGRAMTLYVLSIDRAYVRSMREV